MTIEELCIGGASHRGICYIGALKRLEELGILKRENIKKAVGVSIGSFVLFAYIASSNMDSFFEYVLDLDISNFKDILFTSEPIGFVNSEHIRKWIADTVEKYAGSRDVTMSQLFEKTSVEFIIGTVQLDHGLVFISHKTMPNMKVADALICSMNIPIVFQPYKVDGLHYVDGGLINNFPIHLLDRNRGLGLVTSRAKMTGPFGTIDSLINTVNKHLNNTNNKHEFGHVVEIETNDVFLNFDLSLDDKITLYKKGYNAIDDSIIIAKLLLTTKHALVLEELLQNVSNKCFK
jgi:NTE family protein